MLTQDHDPTALHSVLATDFALLSQDVTSVHDIDAIMDYFISITQRILRDIGRAWNARSTVHDIPAELLAESFAFLPLRDRIAASHVSHAWRRAAIAFPAVWADIDVSFRCRSPDCLIEMALSRSGQVPVVLNYHGFVGDNAVDEAILHVVKSHLHHIRSISWHSGRGGCFKLSLDRPAPLLESLTSNANVDISRDFLCGQVGRLQTLHLPWLGLPVSSPALSTVCDLHSTISTEGADAILRLFNVFPNLQSLTLGALRSSVMPSMSSSPAPPSLTRLSLTAVTDGGGCDLAGLYLAWKTDEIEDVELHFPRGYRFPGTAALPALFSSAVEMDYESHHAGSGESHITLRDARGRTCRLHFLGTSYVIADISKRCSEPINFDALQSLKIDINNMPAFLIHLPRANSLAHITVFLQDQPRMGYPNSLGCLNGLSARLPDLESISLELVPRGAYGNSAQSAREARERLRREIALCGLPCPTEVHIRGSSE